MYGSYGFYGKASSGDSMDPALVKGALDYYASASRRNANIEAQLAALRKTRSMLGKAGSYLDPAIAGLESKLSAARADLEREKALQGETDKTITGVQILIGSVTILSLVGAIALLRR